MNPNPTLLIVDDEPLVRETLHDLLYGYDYTFAFASNGQEGLQQVEQVDPDLILLDVMMPSMDGFEVCRRLKSDKRFQHIPIILITALHDPQDLAYGLEAGADDFLSKPVNSTELRARVRSMLRIKQQYDALEKQRHELEASLHLNKMFSQVIAQHLEALEVLHHAGLRMLNNPEMDYILDLVAQTVLDLLPEASGCAMHLLSGEDNTLLAVVFSPENQTKLVHPMLGIEKIIQQSLDTQEPVTIGDLRRLEIEASLPDMRALLTVPMVDNNNSLGTISVYSAEPDTFEEAHQHILTILAGQAAIAITKARFLKDKDRERWIIRSLFQRYVCPAVVERLVDGQEDLALGGKRQEVSILFADIRGFTTFSEMLEPEQLVEVLNKYLALAVEAIMAQEGTLDKFMGDAVMAIFNAPLLQPDCTLRAARAALAMQQAIAGYNHQAQTHQLLSFGIGIHAGQAVVGNIGTSQQMNYTAIGDTVNLAKRLQENAAGGQILLSQAAYDDVKDAVIVNNLGPLSVKGRAAAENVYELTGLRETINLSSIIRQDSQD